MSSSIKRALISVSDKTGIIEFALAMKQKGIEIISTGGTYALLKQHQIPATYISDVTGFTEMLDGRVKTLHPAVHGGILARRQSTEQMAAIKQANIQPIDMVVVNLYPFAKIAANPDSAWDELIEQIDIGGPAMIRSAAKNHQDVLVVVDPDDYPEVLKAMEQHTDIPLTLKQALAIKAFNLTAEYDKLIATTLQNRSHRDAPLIHHISMEKVSDLRYGENPQQTATLYRNLSKNKSFIDAEQLHGKELSYNNWLDSDCAFRLAQEFTEPCTVIVKHGNPCAVACGNNIEQAFSKGYQADPLSAFGGIVVFNRTVSVEVATALNKSFWEVIIAPAYQAEALAILEQKKNLRLLLVAEEAWTIKPEEECRSISGGWLVQSRDLADKPFEQWHQVTNKQMEPQQQADYLFAWKVVKHVKSNAIVVVKDQVTLGIGAGQMNRVGAVKIALEQAKEKANGAILASDAFFPFADSVELAGTYHVAGIVQPGGSIRDQESIDAANKLNMVMLLTDCRHFRH